MKEIIFHIVADSYDELKEKRIELQNLLKNSELLNDTNFAKQEIKEGYDGTEKTWFAEYVFWDYEMVHNHNTFTKIENNVRCENE